MNNKYKLLFKNTLIFTLGSLGSKVIAFFLVPLYTHYLSTEEYGIADMVFTFAQILVPVLTLMVTSGIFRFGLSKDYEKEDVIRSGLTICLPGLIIMPFISAGLLFYEPVSPWVWYLCFYVITQIMSSIGLCYLKVKDKNGAYALISILQTFIIAICNIIFIAVLHWGIKGYLLSSIIASFASTILTFTTSSIYKDIKISKNQPELIRLMVVFSAPFVINELSWWIIHSFDKLMINEMIGSDALGLYSIASRIPSFITVIVSIFSSAWGISTIKEYEDTKETGFYETVFKLYSFVNVLVALVIIAVVKGFMKVYVGNAFFESWKYVPFLILSTVYASFCNFYGSLYSALKKSMSCMYSSLTAALVNIILNYFLITKLGIFGAVIASAAACFLSIVIRILHINSIMKMKTEKVFIFNNILLVLETIIVSLDWNQIICSCGIIAIFIILNRELVMKFMVMIRDKAKGIINR